MEARQVLETLLSVLSIIFAGAGIYAVVVFIRTLRQAQQTMTEVRERFVPLLEKADVTVDALNAELLRVDNIMSDIEGVSGAVSSATDIIRTPVGVVAGLGSRLAHAFARARRS
ncbi:MAG: hypothetical protein Q8S43_07155 [Actinomycetota bacterium]|nr:MAG: hypothetical protein FD171_768 [Actinomycetota bacterium]MDO8949308.1 hypothetical protein [Actinomycetota bacterium]MDP3630712.1 hypothetical protein [Actinomycetota bacterium]